ncbi:Glutathione reductase [Binucleata daphniae]
MIKKGIKIHFDTGVVKVKQNEIELLNNKANDNQYHSIIGIDFLMCAIGRDCNLDYIKDDISKNGNFVAVNENFETSIKNVYAIGDLIGKNYMLTPYAIFCGRKLIEKIYEDIKNKDSNCETSDDNKTIVQKHRINDYVPSVIFSHPPSASVGLSENEAKKKFGSVKIYESKFVNLFFSLCDKDEKEHSHFKIVTHDDLVIGLHMFGLGCDEIVQGFSVAMKMGATYADFKAVVGVHPTASEEVVTMK